MCTYCSHAKVGRVLEFAISFRYTHRLAAVAAAAETDTEKVMAFNVRRVRVLAVMVRRSLAYENLNENSAMQLNGT